jgi:Leucine-rich repeat (LRR) protein
LRDLKLRNNTLSGELPNSITKLTNLEIIDVRQNMFTSLPENVADLVRLRILDISENQFTSLPFDAFRGLPLAELLTSKNKLSGLLIRLDEEIEMPKLQVLDISANSLTSIGLVRLPSAHQLICSTNRLTELPDMSSWTSLLTLTAEDNSIDSLPPGFVDLPKLKNCDLSGNNIKVLDERISLMSSLDTFRISGNPLRERKFSGMNTEDLKRALKARLAPEPEELAHAQEDSNKSDDSFNTATSTPGSPTADWPVKLGGILDRSNTQSYSLNPVLVARIASNNVIKTLELHHNAFKEIPSSIAFFAGTLTSLSLAHNELTSDTFLNDDLELPALKELNLSSNTFSSLQPLIQRLRAPELEKLDISFNRLTYLPVLKNHFPKLAVVMASNNTIKELSPEAVKGLKVLDCSSNDLNSLNARIGLLGGPGGLERLDVSGNRFRVPKYTILEKGTEATLAWLRDRIPASEVNSSSEE